MLEESDLWFKSIVAHRIGFEHLPEWSRSLDSRSQKLRRVPASDFGVEQDR